MEVGTVDMTPDIKRSYLAESTLSIESEEQQDAGTTLEENELQLSELLTLVHSSVDDTSVGSGNTCSELSLSVVKGTDVTDAQTQGLWSDNNELPLIADWTEVPTPFLLPRIRQYV